MALSASMIGTKRPLADSDQQWRPQKHARLGTPSGAAKDVLPSLAFGRPDLPTPPDSLNGQEEPDRDSLVKRKPIFALSKLDPALTLLKAPIDFVAASNLTLDDEMVVLRKRKATNNVSNEHESRRRLVLGLPNFTARRRSEDGVPTKTPPGFDNPHNYCYRRSVMQSLVNVPSFGAFLQNHRAMQAAQHVNCNGGKPCLLCAFEGVYEACQLRRRARVDFSVQRLDTAIRALGAPAWTRNSSQADAHEFLDEMIFQFMQRFNQASPIVEGLFKLQTVWNWKCDLCNAQNGANPIDDTGLLLPLPKRKNVIDMLDLVEDSFTDQVQGAACATCHQKANRRRRRTIIAGPEVLIVPLGRFCQEYGARGNPRWIKNESDVKIPYDLDLSPYLNRAALEGDGKLRYRLSSVVSHSGSRESGHYRNWGDYTPSGDGKRFYQFDDSIVSKADLKDLVQPPNRGSRKFTPYILVYINTDRRGTSS